MELLNVTTKNVTLINESICIGIDGVVPHLQNDLNLRFNANDMYYRHHQNTHERIFIKPFRKPKQLPTNNGSSVNAVWGMCDMRRFNFNRNLFVRDNLLSTIPQTLMGNNDNIYSHFNGYINSSSSSSSSSSGSNNGNIKFKDDCILHVSGEVCSEVSLFERRIFARFKITAQYEHEPIRTTDLKIQLPEYMFSMLPSPLTTSNCQRPTIKANRTVDETVFYTNLQLTFDDCEYKFIVGFVNDSHNYSSGEVTKIMVRCQTPTSSYVFMKCAEMIYRFYDRMDIIYLMQQPFDSSPQSCSPANGIVSSTSSSPSSVDVPHNRVAKNNNVAHKPGIWSTFKWNVHGANSWEFGECRPITPKLENFLELLVISEVARAFHQTIPATRIHPDIKIYAKINRESNHYSVFNILPALCTSVLLFVGNQNEQSTNSSRNDCCVNGNELSIGSSDIVNNNSISSIKNGYK